LINFLEKSIVAVATLLALAGCSRTPANKSSETQQTVVLAPTLQSATVRFVLPKGDNKNKDTHLAAAITNQALAIARNDDFAGDQEFGDPGNYGPFNLIVTPGITKDQFRGSTTRLTVAPSGEDRVILNAIVEARFSDGETLTSESGVRNADQDSRILEFLNP
jgi:hypothetical protein